MSYLSIFERLLETAELISHHPDFPGKGDTINRCRAEIEDLFRDGQLTMAQRDRLREALRGASRRVLSGAASAS
jgi:hypothetical protein